MSLNGNRTSLCAPVGWTAVSMPRTPTKAGIKTAMPKSASRILFMSFLLGDFQTACFCYCIPHRKLPEEPACADTCLRRERGRQAADRPACADTADGRCAADNFVPAKQQRFPEYTRNYTFFTAPRFISCGGI